MTEIHETRWRCDYCHNVSPVIVLGDLWPKGWILVPRGESGIRYITRDMHFCCPLHKELSLDKTVGITAEVEEAVV